MTKCSKKTPILGPFWALFAQIWAKMNFPEKRTLSAFKYSNYLLSCQKYGKTDELFLRKIPNWRRDRQTDRLTERWTDIQRWFYRTLLRTGLQNMSDFDLNDCTYQTISSQYSLLIPPPAPAPPPRKH